MRARRRPGPSGTADLRDALLVLGPGGEAGLLARQHPALPCLPGEGRPLRASLPAQISHLLLQGLYLALHRIHSGRHLG
ncbi:hypothetical protein EBB05_22575 [Methylobacterium brachiatum]|nr:hypothetical protein EBB05_22575 [Methylobacterium brachiatum]